MEMEKLCPRMAGNTETEQIILVRLFRVLALGKVWWGFAKFYDMLWEMNLSFACASDCHQSWGQKNGFVVSVAAGMSPQGRDMYSHVC